MCSAQSRTPGHSIHNIKVALMGLFRHPQTWQTAKYSKMYLSLLKASTAATVAGYSGIPCADIALVLAINTTRLSRPHTSRLNNRRA